MDRKLVKSSRRQMLSVFYSQIIVVASSTCNPCVGALGLLDFGPTNSTWLLIGQPIFSIAYNLRVTVIERVFKYS